MITQWRYQQDAEYRWRQENDVAHPLAFHVCAEMYDAIIEHMNDLRPDWIGLYIPHYKGIAIFPEAV